jgi:hypothetical protein
MSDPDALDLVIVEAKHFWAGFSIKDGRVDRCAPILRKHLAGKTVDEAREVVKREGWYAYYVKPYKEHA